LIKKIKTYQHFTNSIENYFSMLKSKLQKLDGLTHIELTNNISKVLEKYQKRNIEILREHMKDLKNMYQIKRHEKSRRIIYKNRRFK